VWGEALVKGPENVYTWQNQTPEQWWGSRKRDVTTLVGWAIMVMLLSVGAPFLARRIGITLRHQEAAAPKERHTEYRATKRDQPAERVMFRKKRPRLFRADFELLPLFVARI